jgi:thiol-disulfide isomerase/thioredoxin
MKRILASVAVTLLAAANLGAADLGDTAPPLDIKEWVKGGPVKLADGKGKSIYVVEFWATWCGPCRTSIPHLTEMAKKLKDKGVVFVGVSDEEADVVKKFVAKMGDKMDYHVAIDGGKTSEGYMEAFGINGIPHAFIVDKEGKIAWHGHPMNGLDKALDEMVAGKYDIAAAKARAAKASEGEKKQGEIQRKLNKLAKAIMDGDEGDETKKLEAELVALEKEHGDILGGEKFEPADFRTRVKFSQKVQNYQKLVIAGTDTNAIAQAEKELTVGAPKDFDLKKFKDMMAMQMEMQKSMTVLRSYMQAVSEEGDATKAAELGKKVEALELKNPELLNQIAWAILSEDAIKHRDLKLALTLAKRANDLSEGKEAGIVDTYARALFDNGQVADAVTQQKKAVELADNADLKAELKKSLEKYEAKAKDAPKAEKK